MPLEDKPTLLKLLQLDLEAHPPSAAILSLELHNQSAKPYRAQHGLFLPRVPEPGRLEMLLARLRKLLGEERVGSIELKDDHLPSAFWSERRCPNSSCSAQPIWRCRRWRCSIETADTVRRAFTWKGGSKVCERISERRDGPTRKFMSNVGIRRMTYTS